MTASETKTSPAADKTLSAEKPKSNIVEVRKAAALLPSRLKPLGFVGNNWTIVAEHGVTIQQILEPSFFANVASQMNRYDKVDVHSEDGSYWAELLVLSKTENSVTTDCLRFKNLTMDEKALKDHNSKYEVKWLGPSAKWCVVRKSDNVAVSKGNMNKDLAIAEMNKI